MRIKLLTVLAGPDCAGQVGDFFDVSDDFGAVLIAGGYAEAVENGPGSEVAEMDPIPAETTEAPDSVEP